MLVASRSTALPRLTAGCVRVLGRSCVLARYLHDAPKDSGTFALQSTLPRLPLPKLNETVTKYLRSVEPLVSAADLSKTQKAASEFVAADGLGPVLQRRLEELDASAPNSWLEDIWLKKAYLEWRGPSYLNVNWAAVLSDNPNAPILSRVAADKVSGAQLDRAATLISVLLESNDAINAQTFPADMVRGQPVCMNQFKSQFSTTRIPRPGCDEVKSQYPSTAKHVLVMYRDHAVKVPVYGTSGAPASWDQIIAQLKAATEAVDAEIAASGPQPPVSVLTSADRDLWTKAYASLEQDATNRASLDAVEDALFGVCLDTDMDPATMGDFNANFAEFAHNHTGKNRWFDKAISIIVLPNGRVGVNCEHTPADALTTGRLLLESLAKERGAMPTRAPADAGGVEPPSVLKWNVDTGVASQIQEARDAATRMASDLRVVLTSSETFGSKWIKTVGVSPDAFFQVAMQVAYLRHHGQAVATYESANVRKFKHGRTETIRSCTNEMQAFAREFDDKHVSVDHKLARFAEAAKVHTALTRSASNFQEIDRHLLGLRSMIAGDQEAERATIFNDPSFALSSSFVLSTSNTTPGDMFRGGFAPVVAHGYGINYAIDPADIKFSVSDWVSAPKTNAEEFTGTLIETLHDMQKLGEEGAAAASKRV